MYIAYMIPGNISIGYNYSDVCLVSRMHKISSKIVAALEYEICADSLEIETTQKCNVCSLLSNKIACTCFYNCEIMCK